MLRPATITRRSGGTHNLDVNLRVIFEVLTRKDRPCLQICPQDLNNSWYVSSDVGTTQFSFGRHLLQICRDTSTIQGLKSFGNNSRNNSTNPPYPLTLPVRCRPHLWDNERGCPFGAVFPTAVTRIPLLSSRCRIPHIDKQAIGILLTQEYRTSASLLSSFSTRIGQHNPDGVAGYH